MRGNISSPRITLQLQKYDITTFTDVIFHLPRTYLDLNYTNEMNMLSGAKVTLKGTPLTSAKSFKAKRVSMTRFKFKTDNNFIYNIVAYNQPYLSRLITVGETYTIHGTYNAHLHEISVIKLIKGELLAENLLNPIYSLPLGVKNGQFIKIVQKAFKETSLTNTIPLLLRDKNGLKSKEEALRLVHFPLTHQDVSVGLRTLKYEEGFFFFLKTFLIKRKNEQLYNDKKTTIDLKEANAFIKALPFKLTSDQINAVREIGYDMNKPTLMYRLLQGDVGSGKTIVSFAALYINFLRNAIGALLAPTNALALQHYHSLKLFFKPFPVNIRLLVGSMSASEKKALQEDITNGKVHIIVGTHALFSENVSYPNLELVVIDEQHKFGVNQRNALLQKGDKADLLLLSATPIPQTLAATIYGDLDVTTINEFPNKIRNVTTSIIPNKARVINTLIKDNLAKNEQIYVIASKISEDENYSVEVIGEKLRQSYGAIVGVLHGKMEEDDKTEMMNAFRSGEIKILVATTIVEVGIDVKNASLMIVFTPNYFGLSSLHQLRGRIGRGGQESKFVLVSEESEDEKLVALTKENDGFKIAEIDLKLRGPGELTGIRQSGMPNFMYLNIISDKEMINLTRNDALNALNEKEDREIVNLIEETLKAL